MRFLTGIVAGVVVVGLTIGGGWWFAGLVLSVIAIATWEFCCLVAGMGYPPSALSAAAVGLAFPLAAAFGLPAAGWLLVTLGAVAGPLEMTFRPQRENALIGWALSVGVALYLGALLGPSILLRNRPDGLFWIVSIFTVTWAADTFAFLGGRQWGRHKLEGSVSPNKSIEGLGIGLLAAVVVSALVAVIAGQPLFRLLGFGLTLGIGAILGDLCESALKRQIGTKDSGFIFPGHGGMLDRIDSLLFTAFLGYWYVQLTDGVWPT